MHSGHADKTEVCWGGCVKNGWGGVVKVNNRNILWTSLREAPNEIPGPESPQNSFRFLCRTRLRRTPLLTPDDTFRQMVFFAQGYCVLLWKLSKGVVVAT